MDHTNTLKYQNQAIILNEDSSIDNILSKNDHSKAINKSNHHSNLYNLPFSLEKRTKYFKIEDDLRRVIIFEVIVMNNSLKTVCEKHNINFSSAKNVIQIYKKEGRLEKKSIRIRKGKKHIGSITDPDKSGEVENDTMSAEIEEDTDISPHKNFLML
jgi:hypothetical protein